MQNLVVILLVAFQWVVACNTNLPDPFLLYVQVGLTHETELVPACIDIFYYSLTNKQAGYEATVKLGTLFDCMI